MTDPIWKKVVELTEGYPPEFNAAAVYDLVRSAWRMGFNVVRDPAGPALYLEAIRAQNEALRNAPATAVEGLQNRSTDQPDGDV